GHCKIARGGDADEQAGVSSTNGEFAHRRVALRTSARGTGDGWRRLRQQRAEIDSLLCASRVRDVLVAQYRREKQQRKRAGENNASGTPPRIAFVVGQQAH